MSDCWYAYYPGDYLRDTAHLTMQEDGAYHRLLGHYYSTGHPLPASKDALYRIARAFTESERASVDSVLLGFFQLQEDGYHNKRADIELAKRADHHERLSNAGRKRWHKPGSSQAIASPQPQPQPQEEKKKSTAQAEPSLSFSGQHLSVTDKQDALLGEAFPWVDRQAQYRIADSWLEANPERRPKKANRFIQNWFSRITQPKEGSNGKKLTGDALTEANLRATDSSSRAIREFLAKAGEVYSKQITAPLVAIWLEQLGGYRVEQLEPLFRLLFATCKFFPTPADVLEPLKRAQGAGTPLEAERKWFDVLTYAQSTSPDYPSRPVRIREQTQAAIRAAGGLDWIRDCSPDDLQWAKKRFVEAFTSWHLLEKNQFLLPDGELKTLIAGAAQKLLPEAKP